MWGLKGGQQQKRGEMNSTGLFPMQFDSCGCAVHLYDTVDL